MGLPASLTVDGRVGEHGFTTLTAGFNIYFGGDTSKSLIRRHREDDPPIRGKDIFGAAGDAFQEAGCPIDPETLVCAVPLPPPCDC